MTTKEQLTLEIVNDKCQFRGELFGLIFAGFVPLASQSPLTVIVYSVAKYRPHLSYFWENVISTIQQT